MKSKIDTSALITKQMKAQLSEMQRKKKEKQYINVSARITVDLKERIEAAMAEYAWSWKVIIPESLELMLAALNEWKRDEGGNKKGKVK